MIALSAGVQTRSIESTDKERGVTTLIEELKADQDPRSQCRFCTWLVTQPEKERNEWAEAGPDRSYTHASLFRAARKRGFTGGEGSIEGHRKGLHEVKMP